MTDETDAWITLAEALEDLVKSLEEKRRSAVGLLEQKGIAA